MKEQSGGKERAGGAGLVVVMVAMVVMLRLRLMILLPYCSTDDMRSANSRRLKFDAGQGRYTLYVLQQQHGTVTSG